jgi:glycine/D-amino acid oxidase-like deaminating enzyme
MATEQTIVVGGGLAGLIAAVALAKSGRQVTLFEQSRHLGGRAATTQRDGFSLNLGPHAVYAGGALCRTLREWNVAFSAKPPALSGGAFLAEHGRKFMFPYNTPRLLLTGALGAGDKLQAGKLIKKLLAAQDATGSMKDWLDGAGASGGARRLLEALVAVSTYTRDLAALSAPLGLRQVQLAFSSGVLYVDGGWQSLVAGLEAHARAAGVAIQTGVPVERVGAAWVQLADGRRLACETTVLAVPPEIVENLTGIRLTGCFPVRLASLDIGLRTVPRQAARFALGLDRVLYFSMHSAAAALAPPGGAMVHVAKYLANREEGSREELEQFADLLMPGWREQVAVARFLPGMVVTHALATVEGRPEVDALGLPGVAIAGDWVGNDAMLADAAASSALNAAKWLTASERISHGSFAGVR